MRKNKRGCLLDFSLLPERRLVMTLALRRSLEILQMSQLELSQWLEEEIEKNPLLECTPSSSKKRLEIDLPSKISLYEHLQAQIRESFSSESDRKLAQNCLENLDERGFLLEGAAVPESFLAVLQTFDPPGIFARSLQEALLLQLQRGGRSKTVAYRLVKECFEDLLKGRFAAIQKHLGIDDLSEALRELSRLYFRPAAQYSQDPMRPICPDLRIVRIDGGWTLELVEEELPLVKLQTDYLSVQTQSVEEKQVLRELKVQAKWICRALERRRKFLREIGRILIVKQALFLDEKGPLVSLSVKELAEQLGVHESTLSRGLAGKYAITPRGILPLRSLVTASPKAETAREILEKWIRHENKAKPWTDQELAEKLRAQGFAIARRTIAKYRTQLKIGSATQRKHCR